jgi:hypothetical protein
MHQHLEKCLVPDALPQSEFPCFLYIGLGQSQGYLNGGTPL